MAMFEPGQQDYITKLNYLAGLVDLAQGDKGWSPQIVTVIDGDKVVLQILDWIGGAGTKPASGQFLGDGELVTDIEDAVDVRGGPGGPGPSNVLTIGSVTEGPADATITGTSPSQVLNLVIPKGDKGDSGDSGDDGDAATLTVGTVSTGAPGTNVIINNSGTSSAAVLDFTIPRGDKGDKGDEGDKGDKGDSGDAATITVGTVTTGAPGTDAIVTNVGTSSAAIFDITIPRGDPGEGSGDVASVNGVMPDEGGNVELDPSDIGAIEEAPIDGKDYARKDGDWVEIEPGVFSWNDLEDKPAFIGAGATTADARSAIGAGTSDFDGDYNNLSNKPTIPAAQQQTDWNAVSGIMSIANKPSVIAAGADQAAARIAISAASTSDLASKQDTLVSETNIKSINGESVLGSGDLSVSGVPTGSVIFSVSELEAPDFLPCNGLLALSSSYPTLSDLINAPVLANTLTSVSTLNSFGSNRMCVSKDGLSVYTVSATSPYLRGASINASTGALTAYSNPSGLVSGIGSNEVFTNEDGTLVLCHSSSDVYIYQRSGSTLTSYTSLSISNINDVTTDEYLTYIAVAHAMGIRIFKRTGATLNELTLPSSVSGTAHNTINFTGNGKFLLMSKTGVTRFNYCVRNGDTFSELTAVPTQPSSGLSQICSSYTGNAILGHDGMTNNNKIWLAASGDQLLSMNSPPTITNNSVNYVKISRSGNLISLALASSPWAIVLKWDGLVWSSNLITSAIGSAISRSVTPVREGVMILVNNNSGNTQTIRNTSSYDHTSQFPLPTQASKTTGIVTTQAYIKT